MKKTIFVLAIIAALAIALYKWLTNGENEGNSRKQQLRKLKKNLQQVKKKQLSQKKQPRRLKKMAKQSK